MRPNQQLNDPNGKQVCLFPLEGFIISQGWWETFSHNPNSYYATDFLPTDENGTRLFRAPCYAPVDLQLLWKDPVECCALWQSVNPEVHFADDTLDYLGIIVYHDNDIANGTYSNVGDIKRQGEIFNRSGTGGNVTGDHVHLETGKGQVNLNHYRYHFTDASSCKRIVPDNALFVNDTRVTPYPQYTWKTYEGGVVPPGPGPTPTPTEWKGNKWLKARSKKIRIIY